MVQYGLDYTRCRWILPLLLGLAMIFGIISLAGWGWVTSQTFPFVTEGSLWKLCSLENGRLCTSLMDFAWGRGAAGTFLVGFVLVCICFALSIIAFAIPTLRFNFIRGIGGLCFLAAVFSLMGLVIYAVMISTRVSFPVNTVHVFDWSYGFGWTMCIMSIGLGFFFCCLPSMKIIFWETSNLNFIKISYKEQQGHHRESLTVCGPKKHTGIPTSSSPICKNIRICRGLTAQKKV